MDAMRCYLSVDDAYLMPKLIRVESNLFAACFFLMKLLPAKYMLDWARRDGQIDNETIILESTSGTFGLALALICNRLGNRLLLVSDPAVDSALKRRMEDLGATVEICETPAATGGYQRARLNRLEEIRAQYPNSYWPEQYKNPKNPGSYAALAEFLLSRLGKVDCLVGTVGSGGSMCGTSRFLQTINSDVEVVGVDTHSSVLFGRPDGHRVIRGLGNSIMPPNLDHTAFDEVHWLNAQETIFATRQLHRKTGLFMGPTSGAAYQVAKHHARLNPDKTIVFLCADEGYRYLDSVFNDFWIEQQGLALDAMPDHPSCLRHPLDQADDWAFLRWGRKRLSEVTGQSTCEQYVI